MAKRGKDQSQSVSDMIDHFMEYHNIGYGIPEIAAKFGLSTTTVYSKLQEIAEKNGFYDRKELLERIHPKHNVTTGNRTAVSSDFEEVLNYASSIKEMIAAAKKDIENIIINEEENEDD